MGGVDTRHLATQPSLATPYLQACASRHPTAVLETTIPAVAYVWFVGASRSTWGVGVVR